METRKQGTTLFTAIAVLIGMLVVMQLWLVAAALEAFLSGNRGVLVPAAVASFLVLAVNAGLLLYIVRFDERIRRLEEPPVD
ncbi:MAG TPA: DUF6755 family protein [Thermoanaerobaculia bacterium]|jgi:hypothetical protein|nr:DUF6755 family protein [Thermoanaerobaculia bacterium]